MAKTAVKSPIQYTWSTISWHWKLNQWCSCWKARAQTPRPQCDLVPCSLTVSAAAAAAAAEGDSDGKDTRVSSSTWSSVIRLQDDFTALEPGLPLCKCNKKTPLKEQQRLLFGFCLYLSQGQRRKHHLERAAAGLEQHNPPELKHPWAQILHCFHCRRHPRSLSLSFSLSFSLSLSPSLLPSLQHRRCYRCLRVTGEKRLHFLPSQKVRLCFSGRREIRFCLR